MSKANYTYRKDHIPMGTAHSRRPALPLAATTITIHNTGNPTSTAKNERSWLTDNPSNDRTASYHIVVDANEAIECLPLNENAWHAGDGSGSASGNRTSIGIEICERDVKLADFKRDVLSGNYIKPSRVTFEKFVKNTWKENYANTELGDYTRGNYMYLINTHLITHFGHMELSEIQTMHIVKFMTFLKTPEARRKQNGKPLSTSSQLNIYKALKAIFDAATEWKIISSNPIEGVKRPVADKKEKREIRTRKKSYTKAEAEQLILALYKEPKKWRLYFIGVMLGGFRRGEMLGIEWHNVDFENNSIYIETQITFDEDGKKVEGELKTEFSEGWVAMPVWYMDELKLYKNEWLEEMKACPKWEGGKKQYVFHSGSGVMYFPTTPTTTWRKFLLRNELPRIRLHDLRHTTATLLRAYKVDLKAIQERLRHSKLSTTVDLYTHESEIISREAADTFDMLDPDKIVHPQSIPNALH